MADKLARSFRKRPTVAEARLWKELKGLRAQGFHFRRQVPVDSFIVDFACFGQRLIIEVDGSQHDQPSGLSAGFGAGCAFEMAGLHGYEIRNSDVLRHADGVVEAILRELGAFNGDRK